MKKSALTLAALLVLSSNVFAESTEGKSVEELLKTKQVETSGLNAFTANANALGLVVTVGAAAGAFTLVTLALKDQEVNNTTSSATSTSTTTSTN